MSDERRDELPPLEYTELKPGWLKRELDATEREAIVGAAVARLRRDIQSAMQEGTE